MTQIKVIHLQNKKEGKRWVFRLKYYSFYLTRLATLNSDEVTFARFVDSGPLPKSK